MRSPADDKPASGFDRDLFLFWALYLGIVGWTVFELVGLIIEALERT